MKHVMFSHGLLCASIIPERPNMVCAKIANCLIILHDYTSFLIFVVIPHPKVALSK